MPKIFSYSCRLSRVSSDPHSTPSLLFSVLSSSVFFTVANPIDIQPDRREIEHDLNKPSIAPHKHAWRSHHNTVCSDRGSAILSNLIARNYSFRHTTSDLYRLGIPHSAIEQVETNRKENVCRLIQQFGKLPNKNMLLKDFEKSEEINHFSRESKDLMNEMGNNEVFEFYETTSKGQCSDCALYF